jgi:hypothetical protein
VVAVQGLGVFLSTADALHPADAIVVLGGEASGFHRTQHALDLYSAGNAPVVVSSGATLLDAGVGCSSVQLLLEATQQLGLPDGAALIAPEAQSTRDEAVNLAGWPANTTDAR